MVFPQIGTRTLGKGERMRLPWPAAKITNPSGAEIEEGRFILDSFLKTPFHQKMNQLSNNLMIVSVRVWAIINQLELKDFFLISLFVF
jgi:hypothetical protein